LAKKAESAATSARVVGETIEGFAEDLGKVLGTAQAKASSWLEQRKSIAEQLTQIRDTANDYLQRLSGEAASVAGAFKRGRRGRPPGSKNNQARARKGKPGRPPGSGKKKGGMSAEGRARIAAAQKARWAKLRREAKPKGKVGQGGNG
jgi:hypothetical protein